jgi:hypothetical protein
MRGLSIHVHEAHLNRIVRLGSRGWLGYSMIYLEKPSNSLDSAPWREVYGRVLGVFYRSTFGL